jgi:hypothetical protein
LPVEEEAHPFGDDAMLVDDEDAYRCHAVSVGAQPASPLVQRRNLLADFPQAALGFSRDANRELPDADRHQHFYLPGYDRRRLRPGEARRPDVGQRRTVARGVATVGTKLSSGAATGCGLSAARVHTPEKEHTMSNDDFTLEELDEQHTAELPGRRLMTGLALGLPYLGIGGVDLYVEVGPAAFGVSVYL